MPLTEKGQKIMRGMKEQYGEEKGERVFYASKNAGKISGVDAGIFGTRPSEAADGEEKDTQKGAKIREALEEEYGKAKGTEVFYAGINKGRFTGTGHDAASDGLGAHVTGQLEKPEGGGEHPDKEGPEPPEHKAIDQSPIALAGGFLAKQALGEVGTKVATGLTGQSGTIGSQASENQIMGRPASAGAFSATPGPSSTGDRMRPPDRQIGSLRDYAAAAGAKRKP